MPLIIICGFPCSGKSRRAQELRDYFIKNTDKQVCIIGDEIHGIDKNSVYAGEFQINALSLDNYLTEYLTQIFESLWLEHGVVLQVPKRQQKNGLKTIQWTKVLHDGYRMIGCLF